MHQHAPHYRLFNRVAVAVLVLAGNPVFAHDDASVSSRVQVAWAPIETLSEVKDNPMQRGWLRPEDWMKTLGDYLRKRSDILLPPGQQLRVTIDDIKLAGDFEPWRAPSAQDIRFLTDLHPPRIDLHYTLLAPDGSTIREGKDRLRDLSYLQRTVPTTTDPLRYDKRLIDDWLRKQFARTQS
ncbi:MAG: DUF3016 domain-containing protein [Rudaea sp.]|nr:DUF3016 domain-containing protein [Rudaea sp.]